MKTYPVALLGFVKGPVRWKTRTGGDLYWMRNMILFFTGKMKVTDDERSEHFYAIAHAQKKSKFGFLLMWPLRFHVWLRIKRP